EHRINLYVDGILIADFIPFANRGVGKIDQLYLASAGDVEIEDIFLFNYDYAADDNPRMPIRTSIILDENFDEIAEIEGWQTPGYDDTHWKKTSLPAVHGGIREAGESLYLRHKFELNNFERATLVIETI